MDRFATLAMTKRLIDQRFPKVVSNLVDTKRKSFIADIGVVLLIISLSVVVLFHRLGESSLDGDETIYAQVSSEAAFEGRWLPPTFLGTIHQTKPPLKMWVVSGLFGAFGQSAFVARLPDALLGVATLLLVYLFGKGRFGRAASACGVVMLLGAHQFVFHHGLRSSVQEGAVVFLGTIMLFNWLQLSSASDGRRPSLAPATVAGGLLGFIKNPLGVFFAAALFVQAVIESVFRDRWREGLLVKTLVVTVMAVSCWTAWIVYMGHVTGGHYYDYLVRDVVERSVEGFPQHVESADFYVRSLWADFVFWWLFALPAGWSAWHGTRKSARDTDRAALHLLVWIVLVVAAFSMSASKLSWYVYPAYPAIALFLGLGVSRTAATLADIAGSRFRRLMWVGVAAMLTIQMAAAWRVADQDRVMRDMQRFAEAYKTLPDATVSVDYQELRRRGRFRSWNVFYLYWLPGIRWNEESRPDAADSDCRFAVVADAGPYLAGGWHLILEVRKRDARAIPLQIVGTCPLDLPPVGGRNPGIRRDDLQQAREAVRSWTGL